MSVLIIMAGVATCAIEVVFAAFAIHVWAELICWGRWRWIVRAATLLSVPAIYAAYCALARPWAGEAAEWFLLLTALPWAFVSWVMAAGAIFLAGVELSEWGRERLQRRRPRRLGDD